MTLLAPTRARRAGLDAIPGDAGLPLVNHNLAMLTGSIFTDMRPFERHGELYWNKTLGKARITAVGPDAAATILLNRGKAFAGGPAFAEMLHPFFERGLLLLDFEEHRQNRHIMQGAFGHDQLVRYFASMQPTIEAAIDDLGERRALALYPRVKQLGMDIAVRTFMGEEPGAEASTVIKAFQDCLDAAVSVIRYPLPMTQWRRGLRARKILEGYIRPRIPRARARQGDDLLSALCQAEEDGGARFSDTDIVNHMIFLLLAAHDTSTTTMANIAYLLAKHPEWQERCRAESRAIGSADLEYADLECLPSLDLVFKESLRLLAPVPGMLRMAIRDTEICGYFVPKGTPVQVSSQLLHRNPAVWNHPDQFDPERFSDERREDKVHRHAFIPFGGGVHKCIGMYFGGMEVKAVLHQMLRKYEWSVRPAYEMPILWRGLPCPKDGLPIRITRRAA